MHVHLYYQDQEGALEPTSTLALLARKWVSGEELSEKDVRYCLAVYMDLSHTESHEVMRVNDPLDASTPAGKIYNDVIRSKGNHTYAIGGEEILRKKLDKVEGHFTKENCQGLPEVARGWICDVGTSRQQLNPHLSYVLTESESCIWVVQLEIESNLDANKEAIQRRINCLDNNEISTPVHFEFGGGDVESTGGVIPFLGDLPDTKNGPTDYNILRISEERQTSKIDEKMVGDTRVTTWNFDVDEPVSSNQKGSKMIKERFQTQNQPEAEPEAEPAARLTAEYADQYETPGNPHVFNPEDNVGRIMAKVKAIEFMQGVSGAKAVDAYNVAAEFLHPRDKIRGATRILALTGEKADAQALVETFSSLETPHVASELKQAMQLSGNWAPSVASVYPRGLMNRFPESYHKKVEEHM